MTKKPGDHTSPTSCISTLVYRATSKRFLHTQLTNVNVDAKLLLQSLRDSDHTSAVVLTKRKQGEGRSRDIYRPSRPRVSRLSQVQCTAVVLSSVKSRIGPVSLPPSE